MTERAASATRAKGGVSANEGVVLGMLARAPGSGYDLVRRIRGSIGYFWTPARSHVYSLLPRLVSLGLATRREVPGESAPDRSVYELTDDGRAALAEWLASPDLADGPPRNPFLVKLFFGDVLDRRAMASHVRERRDRIATELAELEGIERTIDPANTYGRLALRYGLAVDRAILAWAGEALEELG